MQTSPITTDGNCRHAELDTLTYTLGRYIYKHNILYLELHPELKMRAYVQIFSNNFAQNSTLAIAMHFIVGAVVIAQRAGKPLKLYVNAVKPNTRRKFQFIFSSHMRLERMNICMAIVVFFVLENIVNRFWHWLPFNL